MSRVSIEDCFLNKSVETMNWEKRQRSLDLRFREIVRFANDHSPAYRDIFSEAGIDVESINGLADLERLPIIRMDDMVERQRLEPPFGGFLTADPSQVRRVYVNPGLILQPGEWEYTDTSWTEGLAAAGFAKGDLILNTFNYHLWPYAFILDESARMLGATIVPAGGGSTLMQVNIMQRLGINAFLGTPSYLNTLVQRAEAAGLNPRTDLKLEKAMVGAEMLPESLRSRLEEKLDIPIRQTYGTVYLGCIGYECACQTGLHTPDNLIVEVIDPSTGRPAPKGASGEITVTSFNRFHPMIRFATGDLSIMTDEECPCGRTGPMLKKVLGRVDQATKVHGAFVHPWQTDQVIARHPEVFKYKVVITREDDVDRMTFWVELKDENASQGIVKSRIERDIKELLGLKGAVAVVPRGALPDFHQKIEDRRSWE